MIDSFAAALTVATGLTAVVVLVAAVRGRYRWRAARPVLVGAEVALVVQAVVAVVALLGGHQPREPFVNLAYLAASVLVLPATIVQVRSDDERWAGVLVAVALLVVAVVVVRAQTTWRPV